MRRFSCYLGGSDVLVVEQARGHVVVEISPFVVTIAHGHFEFKS